MSGYLRTGMGLSITRPDAAQPSGMYYHGRSGTTFTIERSDRGMVHRMRRAGLEASYPVDYVIGSGNAAFGFLVRVGDSIVQSPIAYYSEQGTWGMAPGMEGYSDPDFTRPATAGCLWCHAGQPRPVAGSVSRYEDPAFGREAISCDRCHGDPEAHLATPRSSTIFNPAEAPTRERDSVCEQCHLSGFVRVLHPNQTFGAFEPGRRLEEFWSVFVGGSGEADGGPRFQVVSHVEQLALSRCAQRSGRELWCGTCHDPHAVPEDPVLEISGKCVSCHAGARADGHATLGGDCVTCHMPKRASHDSGHSAFTDHRIARRPDPSDSSAKPESVEPWVPVDGPLGLRSFGIASIRFGQGEGPASAIDEGVALLKRVAAMAEPDAGLLEALGTGLVLTGRLQEGLRTLERAVRMEPHRILYRNSLGAARWEAGAGREATVEFERATREEPFLESSYHLLARVHLAMGNRTKAREAWQQLLAKRPELVFPRQQLRLLEKD